MNDDETTDLLHRLAQSYNSPPETPRDAMWERIEHGRTRVVPIGAATAARRTRWLGTAAGVAAVLLLGVAIGRFSRRDAQPRVTIASRRAPLDSEHTLAPATATATAATARVEPSEDTTERATNAVRAERERRLAVRGTQHERAARVATSSGARQRATGATGDAGDMSAYRFAVLEHMARTEVLLTSFRAQTRATGSDRTAEAQFASLSRELLRNTRLLLATGPGDDPTLTHLLEDLELVLMQISQYTAEGRRGDLDAINQSLERRNVLPKLRSTIPAGVSPSSGT